MAAESREEETIKCDNCSHEYGRLDGDLCPVCGHDNKEQFDENYGEVD